MQKMKRGAVALAYNDIGSGDAAPLLFVHGWGCNHTHFGPQQMILGKSRRTVAVDLRGHVASDAPSQEYTVAGFADDLVWQCRELELVKPVVVGHSMGRTIALELAAATSSGLRTTGSLRGSWTNVRWRAPSARSSVTAKKNRNAATVELIIGAPARFSVNRNWKQRRSSLVAVSGDRPRNLVS
jgi:pimeloyl-ACP methyl ester carboxylesterase